MQARIHAATQGRPLNVLDRERHELPRDTARVVETLARHDIHVVA